jgi:hypothetical protein
MDAMLRICCLSLMLCSLCTPAKGQLNVSVLKKQISDDVKEHLVSFNGGWIKLTGRELHYALPHFDDSSAYQDLSNTKPDATSHEFIICKHSPMEKLYEIAQMRLLFSSEHQKLFWEPLLEKAEARVLQVIREQAQSGNKLRTFREMSAFGRNIDDIFTDALKAYCAQHNLTPIPDVAPAPQVPCEVIFVTRQPYDSVLIMPLTQFRMSEALGEEILPTRYSIGKPYILLVGSYVYSFNMPGPRNRPLKIKIYESGKFPL